MPEDGLKPLPNDIVALFLEALESLPPRRSARLALRHARHKRPPIFAEMLDYDVLWLDRQIGRIWYFEYPKHPWEKLPPWHWHWRGVPGIEDSEGHAQSLDAAMADFRKAWDERDLGVATA